MEEVSLPETNPPKNPIKGTNRGKIIPKFVEVNSESIATILSEGLFGAELLSIQATAKKEAEEIIGRTARF